ncbi:adenylyltransferase/cytidyltransferase family protein [uncultured Tateyamaria sp.]|uniref:adenylyltransferase/cytidyltransferase family protein n=1 Tax=uncultured Tateyamaria sp. TaxID=455651 RepID=UPI002638BECF|nr:adenylyltransferase/cytidyltransferase family protein [uncultured Tateyamaria sp.]
MIGPDRRQRTLLTYGTFDLFHIGHVRLLERLKAFGDRLIVGCSTDAFNGIKGKASVMPYEERRDILLACRHVDMVIPETCWEQKPEDVRTYDVDLFAMGDDWAGRFDFLSPLCEVIYLPRTPNISTTELREKTLEFRGMSPPSNAAE